MKKGQLLSAAMAGILAVNLAGGAAMADTKKVDKVATGNPTITKDGCKGKDHCKGKKGGFFGFFKGKDHCHSKDACKGKDKVKDKDKCKGKEGCGGKDGCGGH